MLLVSDIELFLRAEFRIGNRLGLFFLCPYEPWELFFYVDFAYYADSIFNLLRESNNWADINNWLIITEPLIILYS